MGSLGHSAVSPVLPETGRHRQPQVRAIGVGKAVPQRGADVVRFEIQLIEPGEPGRDVRMCDIDLSEPAEAREVGEVRVPGRRLLRVRLKEPQERELAHGLVQSIPRPSARSLTDDE